MDLWCHHIDVTSLYTDLTDNTSFDKVKFWVDQLKAAEPVSCLKWWPGLAQIKLAITHWYYVLTVRTARFIFVELSLT